MHGRKPIRRIEKLTDPDPEATSRDDMSDELPLEEISLEDLGNAYAAAMQWERSEEDAVNESAVTEATSRERDSQAHAFPTSIGHSSGEGDPPKELQSDFPSIVDHSIAIPSESDGVPIDLCSIVEALLFVGTQDANPIPISALVELLRDFHEQEIEEAVRQLNKSLRLQASALEVRLEGDAYALRVTEELLPVLERIQSPVKETQLTQLAIDCLSLIAYQPGITKESLESQWGQPAGGILTNLIKKGLVRCESDPTEPMTEADSTPPIQNQSDSPAPPRYFTTERFLAILGLESLEDLPRGDEV